MHTYSVTGSGRLATAVQYVRCPARHSSYGCRLSGRSIVDSSLGMQVRNGTSVRGTSQLLVMQWPYYVPASSTCITYMVRHTYSIDMMVF
jgi:hypothetical protein